MIFVVVPAYNEEKSIGRVIRGLLREGYLNTVVVDDGSTDKTAVEAASAGATVLRHIINRGQGAALQTGNDFALNQGAEVVVHFDADGQFNPRDVAEAVAALEKNGADAVFGSRFLDNRSHLPFLKRFFLLPASRVLNNILTGANLTDVHNGFRVLSRSALQKIRITQDRMAHNSEIVASVKKLGLKYIEIPVEVSYSEYGQGITGGLWILWDIFISFLTK